MNLKLCKRTVSTILTVVLLFSFTVTVYGSEKNFNKDICNKIADAFYNLDSDAYGFNDIVIEQVEIGNIIYSYEYKNDSLITLGYKLYPMSYNGRLFAFAIKQDSNESILISTNLVKEISLYVDTNTPFAIIYDKSTCYVYTDAGLTSLCKTNETYNRQDLIKTSSNPFLKMINLNKYNPIVSLKDSCDSSIFDSSYTMVSNYVSCSVPFVTQNPPSNYCWASCVACIGSYLTGNSYTGINVAQGIYGSNYNQGASGDVAMTVLNSLCGTTYSYHYSIPSDSLIYNSISNSKPIYGTWSYGGGSHATVIHGINMIGGYIYIMDPEYGFGSAVASGNTYTYISLYSGVTLSLAGYGALY